MTSCLFWGYADSAPGGLESRRASIHDISREEEQWYSSRSRFRARKISLLIGVVDKAAKETEHANEWHVDKVKRSFGDKMTNLKSRTLL